MFRIDGQGATQDNKFTQGDPGNGVGATAVTDEWLNAVQEELAAAIEDAGIILDKSDLGQLAQVLRARTRSVTSILEMQSLNVSGLAGGQQVNVTTTGRSGAFMWVTGDQSAKVTSDPEQGVWVAPNSDLTGASGAFRRSYNYWGEKLTAWFGSEEASDQALVVQAAIDYFSTAGRAVVTLSPGSAYRFDSGVNIKNGVYLKADGTSITLGLSGVLRLGNNSTFSGQGTTVNCEDGYAVTAFERIDKTIANVSEILGFPAVTNLSAAPALESRGIDLTGFLRSKIELKLSGFATLLFGNGDTVQCYYNDVHLYLTGGVSGRVTYGIRIQGALFNGNVFHIHQCNGMDYGVFAVGTGGITFNLKYMENIYKDGFNFESAISPTIVGGVIEGKMDPDTGITGYAINNRGTTRGLNVVGTSFGADFNGSANRFNQTANCTFTNLNTSATEQLMNVSGAVDRLYDKKSVFMPGPHFRGYITAADGDTTPSVDDSDYLVVSNAGATSITTFDQLTSRGVRELTVFAVGSTTSIVHNSGIRTATAANVAMPSQGMMRFIRLEGISTNWFEVWRNF